MYALGLTGGIGMGKSTVAKMFVENGLYHFDADAEVHYLYGWADPPPERDHAMFREHQKNFLDNFADEFPGLLTEDGTAVDRALLRAAVERNGSMLAKLSQFLKPDMNGLVYSAITLAVHRAAPVLFDVPLLLEGDMKTFVKMCAESRQYPYATVVVSCPAEVQRERVLARPGMSQERLDAILARQMPDEEKRALADHILDTSGSLEEVRTQVDSLCTLLKLSSAA